ncbi:MAG: M3 family oligoendopeptidase [Lachnospiraceae bacterium]|nr:M3 family oligoendopeptidase [Lachnospiraceae bacterium]
MSGKTFKDFQDLPYNRVDMKKLEEDLAALGVKLEEATSGEAAFAVHQQYYELVGHAMTEMTIAEIRHDIDMTDETYSAENDYYDEMRPVFQSADNEYQKKLYNSPYRAYLEEKIGPVAFKNIELAMKSIDQKIIPLMQEENALTSRYNKLLAGAEIEWNGEKLNLSLMTPYLTSSDRQVRKDAWKKYTAFFEENEEEIEDIYDRLVKNRTKQGRELGYENYLPLGYARMMRNCYDGEMLKEFRSQVERDLVPFAEKLHEQRRIRLGLDHLSYIDEGVFFTNGNPAPTGTPEEILAAGREMYRELSPETGRFMDFMCDHGLFDVLGRKTKKTGGYMTYLPDYRAPFIFANFNGTNGDIDVITHECGHAFQGFVVAEDPIREHADITMETAETHSMSMEFFTEPWMEKFFGDQADAYRRLHIEDAVMFIPYGTMVDEFQNIIYADPSLSPKARNQVWHDLERRYKPHLDYTGCDLYERGTFWQNKHHIFDCPLYYIDYCIAQIDALQYKAWMDRDYKGAWESYLKLCKLSASDFFTGMVKQVGLRSPFEDGCIRDVISELERTVK